MVLWHEGPCRDRQPQQADPFGDRDRRPVADSAMVPALLHGRETRVWGDRAYQGQTAILRRVAPQVQDFTNRRVRYQGVVDPAEWAKNPDQA